LKLSEVRRNLPLALFAIAGTSAVAAMVTAGTVAIVTTPASAATSSGEATFCYTFAHEGDTGGYRDFVAVHNAAPGANAVTSARYYRWQAAILEGLPRVTLRTDAYSVYAACRKAGS